MEHGDFRFTIAEVSRETFEGRNGQPAQTRVVLTSSDNPPRKFSLNKVNLRTLATAWSKLANQWIGHTILIYFEPTIEVGGSIVGGQRSGGREILHSGLRALDLAEQAEAQIKGDGQASKDRFGQLRAHPLLATARDFRAQWLAALKALNLAVGTPPKVGRPGAED